MITGDHSWGRDLAECQADLDFIMALPGRKILLRGNHDMFWDAKKTEDLNEMFRGKLEFLQNNFYTYEDYALVGTKGYCYEGKDSYEPVSYTHLDVYKRQDLWKQKKGIWYAEHTVIE